jgi:hypothetical protein
MVTVRGRVLLGEIRVRSKAIERVPGLSRDRSLTP